MKLLVIGVSIFSLAFASRDKLLVPGAKVAPNEPAVPRFLHPKDNSQYALKRAGTERVIRGQANPLAASRGALQRSQGAGRQNQVNEHVVRANQTAVEVEGLMEVLSDKAKAALLLTKFLAKAKGRVVDAVQGKLAVVRGAMADTHKRLAVIFGQQLRETMGPGTGEGVVERALQMADGIQGLDQSYTVGHHQLAFKASKDVAVLSALLAEPVVPAILTNDTPHLVETPEARARRIAHLQAQLVIIRKEVAVNASLAAEMHLAMAVHLFALQGDSAQENIDRLLDEYRQAVAE